MNTIILFLVIIAIILAIPIKISASIIGAKNSSFISCVIAAVVAVAAQYMCSKLIPGLSEKLGFLLFIPLSGLIYKLVLDTSFIKGLLISIAQSVLLFVFLISISESVVTEESNSSYSSKTVKYSDILAQSDNHIFRRSAAL